MLRPFFYIFTKKHVDAVLIGASRIGRETEMYPSYPENPTLSGPFYFTEGPVRDVAVFLLSLL